MRHSRLRLVELTNVFAKVFPIFVIVIYENVLVIPVFQSFVKNAKP